MQIVIVRHGEAAGGDPDEVRPLTATGRAQARELGRRLAQSDLRPDAVVSSPLLRARQTAELVAREAGVEPAQDDRLAPGATAGDVRAAATGRGDVVVVVGHQPDCGRAAAELAGAAAPPFPPGGMFVVEVP